MENTLIYSLITAESLVAGVVFGALIIAAYIYKNLKFNKKAVANLKTLKRNRSTLLTITVRELDKLETPLKALQYDLEAIKQFNGEKAAYLQCSAYRTESLKEYIHLLEDEELESIVGHIITDTLDIANKIVNLEQLNLQIRKQYQHIINYSYTQYKLCEIGDKDLVVNLNLNKEEIQEKINKIKGEREIQYMRIKKTLKELEHFHDKVEKYSKHRIEHKKFYIRYLSYA